MGIPVHPEQEPDPIGDAQDRLIAELAAQPEQEPVQPTKTGWYVVLEPDFDQPTVRAFGKDGLWWIPLGRGNGDDGWMSGRAYKNWVGPIASIEDEQPFRATPPAAKPAVQLTPKDFEEFVKAELGDIAVSDNGRYISPKIQNYWKIWEHCKTTPPAAAQRKPLTGEEMSQIEARWDASMHGSKIAFVVRETEAAHGIK
jgi:hypothetical protein